MAWTPPSRKTVGDAAPTAAFMNTYVRDNLNETAPAIVTTKGDLLVADGANSIARQAVGSNDDVLIVDTSLGDKIKTGSAGPVRVDWQLPHWGGIGGSGGSHTYPQRSNLFTHFTGDSMSGTTTTSSYIPWAVPSDFNALISVTLYVALSVDGSAGSNWRYQLFNRYGADGEQYDNHSETGTATDVAHVDLKCFGLDASEVFASVAAGDFGVLEFERQGAHANDDVDAGNGVLGLLLEYV